MIRQPRIPPSDLYPTIALLSDRTRFTLSSLARRLAVSNAGLHGQLRRTGLTAFDARRVANVLQSWIDDLDWARTNLLQLADQVGERPVPETQGLSLPPHQPASAPPVQSPPRPETPSSGTGTPPTAAPLRFGTAGSPGSP